MSNAAEPAHPRPFTLRLASSEDAGQVASLIAKVWTKHFGWSVPADDLATHVKTQLSVDRIRTSILDPQMRFVIAVPSSSTSHEDSVSPKHVMEGQPTKDGGSTSATNSDTVLGVAQLIVNTQEDCLTLPNPVELNRLYVEDEYRGMGLAGTLVDAAARIAKEVITERAEGQSENGARCSLWLGVWEDNPRAIRFYEKMGFKPVGEHRFTVGENIRRDLVMEKWVD